MNRHHSHSSYDARSVSQSGANPPRFFGPYQIIRQIGAGGMGQIWQVQRGPKTYALKLLISQDLELTQRFEREAQTLLATEALPGFARIYSYAPTPRPHIVMEYLEAPDLESWRQQWTPTGPQIDEIVQSIACSLEALHNAGFVHRDLKPQNIMMRRLENGAIEPVIIDFGLVANSDFESLTQSQSLLGTPKTMAPEQWKGGAASREPSVDIWAFGVIYYYLLTGEYPVTSNSPISLFKEIQSLDPESVTSKLPPAAATIIQACLQQDPADRPQNLGSLFLLDESSLPRRTKPWVVLFRLAIIAIVVGEIIWQIQIPKIKTPPTLKADIAFVPQTAQAQLLNHYLLRQINSNYKFLSEAQLAAIDGKYQSILTYVKDSKTSRKKLDKIVEIFQFCREKNQNPESINPTETLLLSCLQTNLTNQSLAPQFRQVSETIDFIRAFKRRDYQDALARLALMPCLLKKPKFKQTIRDQLHSLFAFQFMTERTNDSAVFDAEIRPILRDQSKVFQAFNKLLLNSLEGEKRTLRSFDKRSAVIQQLLHYEFGIGDLAWPDLPESVYHEMIEKWQAQQNEFDAAKSTREQQRMYCNSILLQCFYRRQFRKLHSTTKLGISLASQLTVMMKSVETEEILRLRMITVLELLNTNIISFESFRNIIQDRVQNLDRVSGIFNRTSKANFDVLFVNNRGKAYLALCQLAFWTNPNQTIYFVRAKNYQKIPHMFRYLRLNEIDSKLLPSHLKPVFRHYFWKGLYRAIRSKLGPGTDEPHRAPRFNQYGATSREIYHCIYRAFDSLIKGDYLLKHEVLRDQAATAMLVQNFAQAQKLLDQSERELEALRQRVDSPKSQADQAAKQLFMNYTFADEALNIERQKLAIDFVMDTEESLKRVDQNLRKLLKKCEQITGPDLSNIGRLCVRLRKPNYYREFLNLVRSSPGERAHQERQIQKYIRKYNSPPPRKN